MELAGKVALVTGAARGIGRAIATRLAAAGVNVAAVDLAAVDTTMGYALAAPDDLRATCEAVAAAGARAHAIAADVTRRADTERMVDETMRVFGRLDILVNNAGVVVAAPIAVMPEELYDKLMTVNVKGTFLACQAAIPALVQSGAGRIVNISSVAGKTGRAGVGIYCASKFAVIGMTQALADELGPMNVTVNAVCPGFIRSAMWEEVLNRAVAPILGTSEGEAFDAFIANITFLKRPQTPEDIGDAVVFLCRAENITGTTLTVAGGGEVH